MEDLTGLDVLLVVASSKFRDEEYREPAEALARCKAGVVIASSSTQPAVGVNGLKVVPDMTLDEVKPADYAAVIFVGGAGATEYFNSPAAHRIAREALDAGKIVAAICIAPSILANAGLLKGKKVTSFPSEHDNLKAKGATVVREPFVRDGAIITADGPQSARSFAAEICEALAETLPPPAPEIEEPKLPRERPDEL